MSFEFLGVCAHTTRNSASFVYFTYLWLINSERLWLILFPFSLALCNFLVTSLVPIFSVYNFFLKEEIGF